MRHFLEVSKLSIAEEMSRAFRVKGPVLRMFFPVNSQKGVLGHLSFPSILFDAEPLCSFPFHMPDPHAFRDSLVFTSCFPAGMQGCSCSLAASSFLVCSEIHTQVLMLGWQTLLPNKPCLPFRDFEKFTVKQV